MVGIGHLLAEVEVEKVAISPALRNIGIAAAATALAGGGYAAHQYGGRIAEQDYANGLRDNTPPLIDGGLIGRRAYKRRLAELNAQQQKEAVPLRAALGYSNRLEDIVPPSVLGLAGVGALGIGAYQTYRQVKKRRLAELNAQQQ